MLDQEEKVKRTKPIELIVLIAVLGIVCILILLVSFIVETTNESNVSTNEVIVDDMEYKLVPALTKLIPIKNSREILTVGLRMTNLGKESKDVSGDMFELIDAKEAMYEPFNSFYISINPGLSSVKALKYEVPAKASGWKLKIVSGFWSDKEGTIILSD